MKIYKESGLKNWDILKAATINGSKFYNIEDAGEVKENFQANLVLLDSNPISDLENITKIGGVMINGKWNSDKFIQKQLNTLKKKNIK